MVLMMATTLSMELRMLDGPVCEHVLQILDVTNPKPRFWRNQEQLLLQGTLENDPPEAPTWAIGDSSSCMISNYILDTEVSRPADTLCGPPKSRNSINCCCYKSIFGEYECYWYRWWRRWCSWWRWHWAWRSRCSTVRFVKMLYRSCTQVLQNLGFEGVQISFCWQAQ